MRTLIRNWATLSLIILLSGCLTSRKPDYFINDAKSLAPSQRATITAGSNSRIVVCLREIDEELFFVKSAGLLGVNPYQHLGLPNLSSFRISLKPGLVELGLIGCYGVDGRSGVVRVKVDAAAGKNYVIEARMLKGSSGTLSWEPVVSEK